MEKFKRFLIPGGIAALLVLIGLPLIAHAQTTGTGTGTGAWGTLIPTTLFSGTAGNLTTIIKNIIQIVLIAAGLIAFVYLIIGGYQYITAGGNAEQATAARTTLLNAIIGLVIIFASYAVISWFMGQYLQ
jgi:hypothetical protein